MNSKMLKLIINTLESVEIVATENNLSKMLAVNQVLRKALKELEQGGEQNG